MPGQVTEKPGGARCVSKFEASIERAYNPMWRLGHKDPIFFDTDTCARLHITVDFFDADAATEFQSKVLAMMPGVQG